MYTYPKNDRVNSWKTKTNSVPESTASWASTTASFTRDLLVRVLCTSGFQSQMLSILFQLLNVFRSNVEIMNVWPVSNDIFYTSNLRRLISSLASSDLLRVSLEYGFRVLTSKATQTCNNRRRKERRDEIDLEKRWFLVSERKRRKKRRDDVRVL